MPAVAYLANQFPSPVEPYVSDEITELRRKNVQVISCSAHRPGPLPRELRGLANETLYLFPVKPWPAVMASLMVLRRVKSFGEFLRRAVFEGREPPLRRIKAVAHTWLGAYFAVLLEAKNIQHIHIHHGYFGAWVGMVTARLLSISYSLTLHGSDLLIHDAYLDIKLKNCETCFTVSEFNRKHILRKFGPDIARKVVLRRLGVEPGRPAPQQPTPQAQCFVLLSVGRLHAVKNHSFLIDACAVLKSQGLNLLCLIAGEGPERSNLERRIVTLGLQRQVKLLGHVAHDELERLYPMIDLLTLTSKSEGIPVALMEGMAHGRPVLAPAITGIPELVIDLQTGFLYEPGSLQDFVGKVQVIRHSLGLLGPLRQAARNHITENFHRQRNLSSFTRTFLERISLPARRNENPVLQ